MVVYAVRKFIKSCILSFFILLLSGQITLAQDSRIEVYEGRYIIQYKEGRVLPRQSTQIDARFDGVARSLKRSKNGKHALVRDVRSSKAQRSSVRNIITHNEQDSSDFCGQLLASDDNIASCEPEAVLRTEDLPNDSHYDQLWGLDKISAPAAWDETTGGNVIVAVLDTGVDHTHPDLAENMWVNTDEIPGNGIDDDNNGYVDDIHGWNFLGGKDGRSINHETLEITREYVRLTKKFKDTDPKMLNGDAKKEYAYYQKIKEDYETAVDDAKRQMEGAMKNIKPIEDAFDAVEKALGKTDVTAEDLDAVKTDDNEELQGQVDILKRVFGNGLSSRADLDRVKDQVSGQL
ncbi:MAG: hypothetical protein KDD55_11600, partial [Bdellovibrionales bacterium]|nr:hypothetical protein [Bdellovibrionales bacterium]